MADDVWSALVMGSLAFAHSRAGDTVGTSFNDTRSLTKSLFDGSPPGTAKTRLDHLKKDVDAAKAAVQPVIDAVKPQTGRSFAEPVRSEAKGSG